jgi:hypothetical protein
MRVNITSYSVLAALTVIVSAIQVHAQDDIDEPYKRVERLEYRLDSLSALLGELQVTTVIDSPHVQFGIAGPAGTLMDKQHFTSITMTLGRSLTGSPTTSRIRTSRARKTARTTFDPIRNSWSTHRQTSAITLVADSIAGSTRLQPRLSAGARRSQVRC